MKLYTILIFIVILLFSCSKTRYTEISLPAEYYIQNRIDISVVIADVDYYKQKLQELIRIYNSLNPDLYFDVTLVKLEDFDNYLYKKFSLGDFPDLFFCPPTEFFQQLVLQNRILDVTQVLYFDTELLSQFVYPQVQSSLTIDQKVYGLGLVFEYGCMVINQDAIPDSMPEIITLNHLYLLAGKLRNSDYALFNLKSFEDLKALINALLIIYNGPIRFSEPLTIEGNQKMRESFTKAVLFLRKLYKEDLLQINHFIPNAPYTLKKKEGAVAFISAETDKFNSSDGKYVYRTYPSENIKKPRGILFSAGSISSFISSSENRTIWEISSLLDLSRFISFYFTLDPFSPSPLNLFSHEDADFEIIGYDSRLYRDFYLKLIAEETLFDDELKDLKLFPEKREGRYNTVNIPDMVKLLPESEYYSMPPLSFIQNMSDPLLLQKLAVLIAGDKDPSVWWLENIESKARQIDVP